MNLNQAHQAQQAETPFGLSAEQFRDEVRREKNERMKAVAHQQAQQAPTCKTAWAPPTPDSYWVLRDPHRATAPLPPEFYEEMKKRPTNVEPGDGVSMATLQQSAKSAIVAGGVTLSIVSLSESIDMLEQQVSMLIDACMPVLAAPSEIKYDDGHPLPRPSCAISERLHTLRERIDNAAASLRDTRLALAL